MQLNSTQLYASLHNSTQLNSNLTQEQLNK